MSNRPRHPDKDIEAAIAHAEELWMDSKKENWQNSCMGITFVSL